MSRDPAGPMRVAILCNETVPRWIKGVIDTMVSDADVEITLVVVHDSDDDEGGVRVFARSAAARVRKYPLWSVARTIDQCLSAVPDESRVPVETVRGIEEAEWLYCAAKPTDGIGNELPDDVVDVIASEADVVFRYAFGILKGRILRAPRHGVLSYHLGDIREYRGALGKGFWEFLNDEDEMGVTLQQLTESIDDGRIVALERVDVSDARTWQEVKRRVFATAKPMLASGVENLADPSFTPRDSDRVGETYSIPRGEAVVRYMVKNMSGRVTNAVDDTA